jgi:hypothetical protein
MDRFLEASWGRGHDQVVRNSEELDALLDRLDAEARETGRPRDVSLTDPEGGGTLVVVLGHHRSFVHHVPEDLNPPYMASRGDQDEDRPFTFFVGDDHHSETHWRHTIPADAARNAARVFLRTGRLDERVEWEEG